MRVRFGDFVLDTERHELLRYGDRVHLPPKTFQLLQILAEERPKAVAQEDLYDRLWPKTFVEKSNLHNLIYQLREALANREETLKVVSEQLKAPVAVLDTYLLKDNDFGRDPGAAPNFEAIQKMLDIYAATGMLPKLDVAQFKHTTIVAPLQ